MHVPYNLFIHLLVEAFWLLQFGAFENKAAVHIFVQAFVWAWVFMSFGLRSEIGGLYKSVLSFVQTLPNSLPRWRYWFHIPTSKEWKFLLLCTLTNICVLKKVKLFLFSNIKSFIYRCFISFSIHYLLEIVLVFFS